MSTMWLRVRTFRCAICGIESNGRENPDGGYLLPVGWSGSVRRGGACFCKECREKIMGAGK